MVLWISCSKCWFRETEKRICMLYLYICINMNIIFPMNICYESIATIAKAFSNECPVATVFVQGRAESTFWPQLVKALQTGLNKSALSHCLGFPWKRKLRGVWHKVFVRLYGFVTHFEATNITSQIMRLSQFPSQKTCSKCLPVLLCRELGVWGESEAVISWMCRQY